MPQRRTSAPDAKEEGGSCEALGGGFFLFFVDGVGQIDRYLVDFNV